MNRWQFLRDEDGFLTLKHTDIRTGEDRCCGHARETGPEALKGMMDWLCSRGRIMPGDVIYLPDGQLLQLAMVEGMA